MFSRHDRGQRRSQGITGCLSKFIRGMTVYDANGNYIGTVKSVFLGGRPNHDPTLPKSLENRPRMKNFSGVAYPV